MKPLNIAKKLRFGLFEADLQTGELRKSGVKVKLQEQPFRVLAMLLARPGDVVTRQDLQEGVWGSDTFVDFDHSLATAINKIREALGDSSDNPRFVETLARRGYRFIAPVQDVSANGASVRGEHPTAHGALAPKLRGRLRISIAVAIIAFVLGCLTVALLPPPSETPHPLRFARITHSGAVYPGELQLESFPTYVTDGTRICFSEMKGGSVVLADGSITTGDMRLLVTPAEIAGPSLADISPDGSKLLIRNHLAPELEQPLWIVPVLGGQAQRVGNVMAHDATWWPGGQSILYASGNELISTKPDGTDSRKFVATPGRAFWLRWSPDGKELTFTVIDPQTRTLSLWEVSSAGTHLHPMLPGWHDPPEECCGNWTHDGRAFVFQSTHDERTDIWALREKTSRFSRSSKIPVQVTAGPLNFLAPVPSWNGKELFVIGEEVRTELLKFDTSSRQFERLLNAIGPVRRVAFSRDGKWVAYVSPASGSLWRSALDGSERLRLTSPPMETYMMRWSPDGSRIAFMGKTPGRPWKLYLIPADGGTPQQLLAEKRNEADPGWSPDGRSLVFGRPPAYMAEDSTPKAIYMLDIKTGKASTLPGSEGLFSPRWSPDGRYIAAISLNQRHLMLFDRATQKWTALVNRSVDNPVWSPDSKAIYFHAFMESRQPIYRVWLSDHRLEIVVDFQHLRQEGAINYSFLGLTPDDAPLVSIRLSSADIYAVDWRGF
ncbi:MAG: winged helix-turn-helix domain-containing protein [Terriglobia bacterium]